MSTQTLRNALDEQAINDLTAQFRQILAGLGFENAETLDVAPVDMRQNDLLPGQPHFRVTLFALANTDLGRIGVSLLVENDWGGLIEVNVTTAGNLKARIDMPFMPDDLDPQNVVALVRRQVERNTWFYHKMVAKERELGLRD